MIYYCLERPFSIAAIEAFLGESGVEGLSKFLVHSVRFTVLNQR